jgi:hypothetical protein
MKIPFLFLFLCFFSITKATTYYISPTGSDLLGNGTAANPWRSLYKATSAVTSSGNTIHVNAGTYIEILTCNLAPGVSLEGDGVTSVLKSSIVAIWQPLLALTSPEGTNGNQHISNLKFDGGNLLNFWGILIRGRSNISIYNCTIVDFMEGGVVWSGRSDGQAAPPAIYSTGNSFHDNIVTNCANADIGYGRGCFQFGGQDGMLIYNNTIVNNSRPIGQGGWPIKGCNDGYIKDCKIYNNYLESAPYPYSANGTNNYWNFAIEMFYESGLEIYGNTIKGSIDFNHQSKGIYGYSLYIHDNIIGHDNLINGLESGIIMEYSTHTAIIENNVIKNTAYPIYFTPRTNDNITDVTIQKNLIYNVGIADGTHAGFGIAMQTPEDGSVTTNNFFVQNNTIVAAAGSSNASYGVRIPDGGPSKDVRIINNIIKGFNVECIRANPANVIDTLIIKNNNLFQNGNNNGIGFINGTPSNYTNSANISINPLFVSATDFHLLSTSPCVDAGINVGLSYSGTAPDMSYTEYPGVTNTPPTANAGADQVITLPTNSVSLSGSGTDPDGTVTGYAWTKIAGPTAGTISTPGSANTTVTALIQGTYKFELTVTDNNGATGKDTIQVIVNAIPNVAPTANAGPDQTITLPTNSVSLSGSGTDTDGTISSYLWTKVAGPTAGTITTNTSAATTVTALAQGTYKFELKVTDNNGAVGRDTIQVIVNAAPNVAPTANAGPDQTITLPTNSVSLSGSGTDTDGTISSYSWNKISGPAATITNANSAATTVTALTQGTYKFELTVTDNSGAIGKDTMQVIVNAAGNIAPTANAGADQIITLPTNSVSLNGSGTDPDGTIAAYQWTKIVGPTAGTISTPGSANTTVTGLVQGTYKFELTVTDNNGATGKDTIQVIVNATAPPPNVAPTANAGADQTITLPINTVSLSGSGTDTDGTISSYLWTKISGPVATITNANAAATTVTALSQGTYKFELTVTDNNGATGKDTMQVIVNAAAPPPNVAPTANAGVDQTITLPTNSVSLSGSGTDTDGTISSYLWTKISGPAATITNANAAATTVTALIQGTYKFELTVTDNNGATGKDTVQVIVNAAAPPPNVAPTANAGADQTITLPINTVGLSGSGTDTDGTISSYLWTKISGPAAIITNANAAATTVTALTQGTYKFELTVTDNNGATGKDTLQVIVNAAPNVAPTANAGPDQTITLPTNSVSLSGSGTDPDGTISSYLWTKISGPVATITNANSAATTVTALTQGTYKFELKVTDNSGAVDRDTVQIIVNPAPNVAPTANAGIDQSITLPTTSVNLSGSGTDVDGTITGYLWTKISGPSAGIITNNAAAATSVTGLSGGIYKFELKVTDNSGAVGRDTVQVIVFVPNIPPVAHAGLDQSITLPTNTASLTGSGTDIDGTIITYNWTKISGPAAGTIINAGAATTTASGLTTGVYKFELRVTDNNNATARDTMQVTVNPANIPPVANAGPDQSVVLPNKVTLTGSGTDVDGAVISYAWKQIAGPADKLTSPNTAVTVLDNLIAGVYKLELTVTDNKGATDKDTVSFTAIAAVVPSQNSIKLYPNPVVDITTLDINNTNSNGTVLIQVTDLQGKIVYKKQVSAGTYSTKEKINMSGFSKGTYFVTVHFTSQDKQTIKAMKQ